MSKASSPNGLTVRTQSMWRMRLAVELPRYLLQATALIGLLASARFAIAPPRPVIARAANNGAGLVDRSAEGFASLFARRYLTWSASDPEAHRLALAPYLNSSMEADAGLQPPEGGEQRVQWTLVVQARPTSTGGHLYTVAAQTDVAGLLYLTVSVVRGADGALSLGNYPAFIGAPASASAIPAAHLREVEDSALTTVVTRALRNYLARAESELAADLAAGTHISLPVMAFGLQSLDSLDWSPDRHSVLAVVHARDSRGALYTLAYELDVLANAGRWEISAIEISPGI